MKCQCGVHDGKTIQYENRLWIIGHNATVVVMVGITLLCSFYTGRGNGDYDGISFVPLGGGGDDDAVAASACGSDDNGMTISVMLRFIRWYVVVGVWVRVV